MKRIAALWKAESARLVAIGLALVAAGVIPGTWGKILGAVLPILGNEAVRATVYAPDTVTELVQDAAATALTNASSAAAGTIGTLTPAGAAVAAEAASAVLASVPGPAASP